MTDSTTALYIAPSHSVLRRRAGRLALAFGLLIAGVWVVGRLFHQDLLAGVLVIAAIGMGEFLLAAVVQLLMDRVRTEESRASEWDEERDRNPFIPGTKAYWNYGQELLDRDHDD